MKMKTIKIILLIGILLIPLIKLSYCPTFNYGEFKQKIEITKKIEEFKERYKKVQKIHRIIHTIKVIEGNHTYFKEGKLLAGKSGEEGVYQFMPTTWKKLCKRFYGKTLKKTKENQDLIAYRYIEYLLDEDYNLRQIASIWNSGKPNSTAEGINPWGVPYSVPKYIENFLRVYNSYSKGV